MRLLVCGAPAMKEMRVDKIWLHTPQWNCHHDCARIYMADEVDETIAVHVRSRQMDANEARSRIMELEAEVAALRPWKDRLIDAAVVNWVYRKEHETDPALCLNDIIAQVIREAQDPVLNGTSAGEGPVHG